MTKKLFFFFILMVFINLNITNFTEAIEIKDVIIHPYDQKFGIDIVTDVESNITVKYGSNLISSFYIFTNNNFLKEHSMEIDFQISPTLKYRLNVEACTKDPMKCTTSKNFTFETIKCGISWRCFSETEIGYVNEACTWDLNSIKKCDNTCSGGLCLGSESKSSIYVDSNPSIAVIYINGEIKTVTPDVIMGLEPGTYNVRLEKTNYEDYEVDVTVEKGKTKNILGNLKVTLNCEDSDDGKDPLIKGSAFDPFKKFVDKCVNENVLNESYCDESLLAKTTTLDCEFGCNKGKCTGEKVCKDGTKEGQCSSVEKPFFCESGKLVEDCDVCGCPDESVCNKDGSCQDVKNSPGNNNDVFVWIVGILGFLVLAGVIVFIYLEKTKKIKNPFNIFKKKIKP